MFNTVRNTYAYLYLNFAKLLYASAYDINEDEELYGGEDEIIVLVKNEDISKRLYNIITSLAKGEETISTKNVTLKVKKYYTNDTNGIWLFVISYSKRENAEELDKRKLESLKEFVAFVDSMHSKGYVIDKDRFDNEKCSSISNLLSFFVPKSQSADEGERALTDVAKEQELEKISKGCVIQHIHYACTDGGNLDSFYKKVVEEDVISSTTVFPYLLPIMKMCYNYYATGEVPSDIYDILQRETFELGFTDVNVYHSYLVANKEALNSKLKETEVNNEYSVYEGNVKVYNNISQGFADFIKIQAKSKQNLCLEKIESIIINFQGEVIGYKFSISNINYTFKINVADSSCMETHIMYIAFKINELINNMFNSNEIKEVVKSTEGNNFNLEDVIVKKDSVWTNDIRIKGIKELFDFVSTPEEVLRKQELELFFKLYIAYLENKYGELTDEKQFFSKDEVKYISPAVAKNLVNYALRRPMDYNLATKALTDYLDIVIGQHRYDSLYSFRFLFDYEVEAQYGVKIKEEAEKQLSDGRKIVIFGQSMKYSEVMELQNKRRKKVKQLIWSIEDTNLIEISNVICTKKIDSTGMYEAIGYVTEPVKGHRLTDKYLLSLNNKELLEIMAKILRKFDSYFIPGKYIYVDRGDYYVDMMRKNFEIKQRPRYTTKSYLEEVSLRLISKGYNKNAFEGIDWESKESIYSYSLFHAYCKEHGIYYDGSKKLCPVCSKTKYFVEEDYKQQSEKIFEDMYADHYSLTDQYNLKVYKIVNTAELEKNVTAIVEGEAKYYQQLQDCFIPYKKAINENGEFIGYIYKAERFSSSKKFTKIVPETAMGDRGICENIMDLEAMSNLPRIMSLIRLLTQVDEATANGYSFILNPFGDVFLNKAHKKQVQILNIDFLKPKSIIELGKSAKRLTCDYVRKVIFSDPTIEIKLPIILNFDSLLEILQEEAKDMTKYCAVHKMYYKNSYMFCPKCVGKEQFGNMDLEEVNENSIIRQESENEGGEAFIYPYNEKQVAKVFKLDKINYNLKMSVISLVLKKKQVLEEINNKNYKYKYIIPQKLLVGRKSHQVFGYVMDRVNGSPISVLRDKVQIEKLGFKRKDVLEILITIGQGIETLHANNIYIGDLNGRNILFDTNKNVYFLDFDGMGVDNIAPEFCTDGYIDPNSKKAQNITMKDDWYSFAIQAFYYLTFTHPFNGIYTVEENGKTVALDIPQKMERGISLLGYHGMKIPAIAEPWDWMDEMLKNTFLEIFEGNSRISIVPYLIDQYDILYNGGKARSKSILKPSNQSIRINSKFIATKVMPFGENVGRIINHYSAICKEKDEYYVKLLLHDGKQVHVKLNADKCLQIIDTLLSDDEKIFFVVYAKGVLAIDLNTMTQIYEDQINGFKCVVVNGRTLYYAEESNEGNVIVKCDFSSGGEISKKKIKFLPKQQTNYFYVQSNSKFVLVKYASSNVDEIYCNSQKLCDISHKLPYVYYNIIYDSYTKMWLVINHEGNGVIIQATDGTYKRISKNNVKSVSGICFTKGIIYIPAYDKLYIINVNDVKKSQEETIVLDDQATIKELECKSIITSDSKLYNINTEGFSVITQNTLYEIRRG